MPMIGLAGSLCASDAALCEVISVNWCELLDAVVSEVHDVEVPLVVDSYVGGSIQLNRMA